MNLFTSGALLNFALGTMDYPGSDHQSDSRWIASAAGNVALEHKRRGIYCSGLLRWFDNPSNCIQAPGFKAVHRSNDLMYKGIEGLHVSVATNASPELVIGAQGERMM